MGRVEIGWGPDWKVRIVETGEKDEGVSYDVGLNSGTS